MQRLCFGWMILVCTVVSARAGVEIRVRVDAPVPASSGQVFLAGNLEVLGSWDAAGMPLTRQDDGAWTGSFTAEAGEPVEFKVTRGSWETEALDEHLRVPGNHRIEPDSETSITIRVAGWKDRDLPATGKITGTVRYHPKIKGMGLLPRDVVAWLPPGYDAGTFACPVLYMHDGQNVFDPATASFGVDWQIDETCTRMIAEETLPPVIVVGIYCTADRWQEYGGDPDKTEAYLRLITDVIKPMIDTTYRTQPDREHTYIMGSSMGGIISYLAAWERPDVFAGAGCLSPAFMFGDVLDKTEKYEGAPKDLRIYIDNGGVGMDREKLQPSVDDMLDILARKADAIGITYTWYLDNDGEHNEAAWAARAHHPLMFLLGRGE